MMMMIMVIVRQVVMVKVEKFDDLLSKPTFHPVPKEFLVCVLLILTTCSAILFSVLSRGYEKVLGKKQKASSHVYGNMKGEQSLGWHIRRCYKKYTQFGS